MNLLLFILATIGLTNIVVYGEVMSKFRDAVDRNLSPEWSKLVHCFQCAGFYAGLFCGTIIMTHDLLGILMCGFAGSFVSNLSAKIEEYLESNSIVHLEPETDEDK